MSKNDTPHSYSSKDRKTTLTMTTVYTLLTTLPIDELYLVRDHIDRLLSERTSLIGDFCEWAVDAGVEVTIDNDELPHTRHPFHATVYLKYPLGPRPKSEGKWFTKEGAIEIAMLDLMRRFKIELPSDPSEREYTAAEKNGEPGDNGDSLHQPWLTEKQLDDELDAYMADQFYPYPYTRPKSLSQAYTTSMWEDVRTMVPVMLDTSLSTRTLTEIKKLLAGYGTDIVVPYGKDTVIACYRTVSEAEAAKRKILRDTNEFVIIEP